MPILVFIERAAHALLNVFSRKLILLVIIRCIYGSYFIDHEVFISNLAHVLPWYVVHLSYADPTLGEEIIHFFIQL